MIHPPPEPYEPDPEVEELLRNVEYLVSEARKARDWFQDHDKICGFLDAALAPFKSMGT